MKNKEKQKKVYKPRYKKGQEVFLTAFLKKEKSTFYVCRATVEQVPGPNERQVYKAKITAVADRPVGGQPVVKQAQLLGLTVTKSTKELHADLPSFMCPPGWIEKDPGDSHQELTPLDKDGVVDVSRQQIHRLGNRSHQQGKPGKGAGNNGKAKRKRSKTNKGIPAGGHSNSTPKKV